MLRTIMAAWKFLREEDGQDIVEYTLVICCIVLAVAAIFPIVSMNIRFLLQAVFSHLASPPEAVPR